jgi:hypothetical protein
MWLNVASLGLIVANNASHRHEVVASQAADQFSKQVLSFCANLLNAIKTEDPAEQRQSIDLARESLTGMLDHLKDVKISGDRAPPKMFATLNDIKRNFEDNYGHLGVDLSSQPLASQ